MKLLVSVAAILALTSQVINAESCVPGDTCMAPECRCWDDKQAPGGFQKSDIPQMVILSFEYAVSSANVDSYKKLVKDLKNPNGCEPRGTFFVQKKWTDFSVVKDLYDSGHEIGLTSADGKKPEKSEEWVKAYKETKDAIVESGIPASAVRGSRAPDFKVGGNDEFQSIKTNNLTYDSTCVTANHMTQNMLLWPYTYDFVARTPACVSGYPPSTPFPGIWQFIVADLKFKGRKCATPSGCAALMKNSDDVVSFFKQAFSAHYNQGNRAPFLFTLDPAWFTKEYQAVGTKKFLQDITQTNEDVWIVSTQQALAWIKNPVKASSATKFNPWQCNSF